MLDLRKLAPYDAALLQHGLVSTGYLILDGTPKGVPGGKTDAAYAAWVRDNAPGASPVSGTAEELANRIIRIASQFVGLREVVSNASWDKPSTPGPDKELSDRLVALMRPSPWQEGWAYCYTGDTELLTERGWMPFEEVARIHAEGIRVAQVSDANLVSFAKTTGVTQKKATSLAHVRHRDMDLTVDDGHKFWGEWSGAGGYRLAPISEMRSQLRIPPALSSAPEADFSDRDLRFIAAYIADGYRNTHHGKAVCEFRVSVPWKVAELYDLPYTSTSTESKTHHPDAITPLTKFRFDRPERFSEVFADGEEYKGVRWGWALSLSARQCAIFVDACSEWSGSVRENAAHIRTARAAHADLFCAMASLAGYQPKKTSTVNHSGYNVGGTLHHVKYARVEGRHRSIRGEQVDFFEAEPTDVFCVSVPEGKLVVRDRAGSVYTCGNCAAFCEGVVAEALREMGFTPHQIQCWHDVMTPHVVTSARNFESKRAGGQRMLKSTPAPGALWLARKGTTADGHAGIVVSSSGSTLSNIEANTSAGPDVPAKEREGDWVTPRLRNLTKNGSLLTMGFVHPADILKLVR